MGDMNKEPKSKPKQKQKHTVGVEIPDPLFQLINLAAISLDTSRSQIIRNAVRRWIEENKMTVDSQVIEITSTYQDQWNKKKLGLESSQISAEFEKYLEHVSKALEHKNVAESIIAGILAGLTE